MYCTGGRNIRPLRGLRHTNNRKLNQTATMSAIDALKKENKMLMMINHQL